MKKPLRKGLTHSIQRIFGEDADNLNDEEVSQ
jgi:hypothetical protein